MKQKKTMLIMVIVLAVLLALYGGLKAWNSHSEKQKKAKEDKEKVSLVDVKSLKSFAYESGGSKMSFTKENGEWVKKNNKITIKTFFIFTPLFLFSIIPSFFKLLHSFFV